jgi:hypothetical protein
MRRMVMGFPLCLVLFFAASLLLPEMAAAQDVRYLRRMWPVEGPRENFDWEWIEQYPVYWGGVWMEEYIDSDGDDEVSIGDVIDAGENGTYTIFWVGYGLDLRELDGGQEGLIVESTIEEYPIPADPLGDTMLTIWPEFGNELVVTDFVDLDGNGFDPYDEILMGGIWYDLLWFDMDVRTIWEEYEPPQPTAQRTWSSVKGSYR